MYVFGMCYESKIDLPVQKIKTKTISCSQFVQHMQINKTIGPIFGLIEETMDLSCIVLFLL